MSVYQWAGSSNADLGNEGNWVNISNPGTVGTPGTNDAAIIQVGQGLYGVIDVDELYTVQASGAPTVSITGSSTQVTAASAVIGYGFTLDTGAYLQTGALGIDGDGTRVLVQNNAYFYDSAGMNDVLTIGAGSGNSNLLVNKGGSFSYNSTYDTGTLNLGGVSNSVATLTVSADGYASAALSELNIGAAAGSTGVLSVTGPSSQLLVDNYGTTTIGDFGERGGSAQGTVMVSNGGYASLDSYGETDIGTSAGLAKIIVSGTNSEIQSGPVTVLGLYGTNVAGEILVQSGGDFDNATDINVDNGTISVTGANSLLTARVLGVDNGSMVQVGTGGLIRVADAELAGNVKLNAGEVFAHSGFYLYGGSQVSGSGTITATNIGNAGLIIASGGTLVVAGSITGTGVMHIQSGSTLELTGSSVPNQTIQFEAGANKLVLGDAAQVSSHMQDFATGDAVDLLSDPSTTLSYAAGALTVLNGTKQVAKLEIKGSYSAANFKLGTDGHGGSLISYVPTSAVTAPHLPIFLDHPLV